MKPPSRRCLKPWMKVGFEQPSWGTTMFSKISKTQVTFSNLLKHLENMETPAHKHQKVFFGLISYDFIYDLSWIHVARNLQLAPNQVLLFLLFPFSTCFLLVFTEFYRFSTPNKPNPETPPNRGHPDPVTYPTFPGHAEGLLWVLHVEGYPGARPPPAWSQEAAASAVVGCGMVGEAGKRKNRGGCFCLCAFYSLGRKS